MAARKPDTHPTLLALTSSALLLPAYQGAKADAPPSGRSSRVTEVTTTFPANGYLATPPIVGGQRNRRWNVLARGFGGVAEEA